jgi:hypothetical protein
MKEWVEIINVFIAIAIRLGYIAGGLYLIVHGKLAEGLLCFLIMSVLTVKNALVNIHNKMKG